MSKMLQIAIAFYLLSFIVFSVTATFGIDGLDMAYYLCADIGGGGCLLWYVLYRHDRQSRQIVLPVLIFSIIILIWDIISYCMNLGVNNPKATGVGFGIAILIVLYYLRKAKWK